MAPGYIVGVWAISLLIDAPELGQGPYGPRTGGSRFFPQGPLLVSRSTSESVINTAGSWPTRMAPTVPW
jgi:hypothetical protein